MIVEGQVHGGIAQGVGQAMLEGAVYDGGCKLVTGSLMDYTMPRADDLPSFRVDTTMTKCPSNPLGIKGYRATPRDRRSCRRDECHHGCGRYRGHCDAGFT